MSPLEIAGLTVFMSVLFLGIFSTVFSLPGTIIILIDVFIYAIVSGFDRIGFLVLFVLTILSILAEALDFGLSVIGVERFDFSKKGIWAAIAGGVIGAAILSPFFYGLGAISGIFFGGFAGVFIVEMLRQNSFKPALRTSYKSIIGRSALILTKGFVCLVMIVVSLLNVYS